jgi:cysteine desulfurase/selenocysteine lyase
MGPPFVPPGDVPAPSTPYYFMGEASALRSPVVAAQRQLGGQTDGAVPEFDYYFINQQLSSGAAPAPAASQGLDVGAVRRDFPILRERVNGHQLVWLDNAATTQKPQAVIDRLVWFYTHENSNVHRAAHELAARATDALESARAKVAGFLGAASPDNIVFVRGATEAINLVAQSWGRQNIRAGDEIVISHLEHHANIVPWQLLAAEKGAKLRVAPVDDTGQILLGAYRELVNERTRLVAIAHVSNALGTIVPIREVIDIAHAAGACVLVDGAQAVAHERVNVAALDAEFYVFSGHKVFGPTGIGALYGKPEVLEGMPPWQGGGSMISDVTFERSIYQRPPARFEAGTGNIADAIGLGAALDYLQRVGIDKVSQYEHNLLTYATEHLLSVPGLRLIGTAPEKASVLSFVLAGYTPAQVGTALNQYGIAVRAGHHCAQPILRRFGLEATVRASLAMYNTRAEVDQFVDVLRRLAADR